MRAGRVSESDAQTLKKIVELINARAKWYGFVGFQTALVRRNESEWAHLFTKIRMLHRNERTEASRYLNYGRLAILDSFVDVEQATAFAKTLVEQGRVVIPDIADIPLDGTFVYLFENNYLHSNNEQLPLDWPADVFTFEADQGFKGTVTGGTLVAKNLPLYPGPFSAIDHELHVDLQRYSGLQDKVVFLLPNYMAKIAHINLGTSHLSCRIEVLEANLSELIGKLYVEYPIGSQTTDFGVDSETVDIPLKGKASQIWLYLLD